MDKLSLFKEFVKKNPILIQFVKRNDMTWQKFYEIYDLYGEQDNVWGEYLKTPEVVKAASTAAGAVGIGEMFNWLKKLDMDALQNGITSIDRVIGVLRDFNKSDSETPKEEYKPRPLYKSFED